MTSTPSTLHNEGTFRIARQAVLDVEGRALGWELFNRTSAQHTSASDVQLLFAAMVHVGANNLCDDGLLFINCTHDSLAGGHLDLVPPEGVVLEIEHREGLPVAEIVARTPILRSLRERGFKLCLSQQALDPTYSTWLALADFVRVNVMHTAPQNLSPIINRAVQHSRARVIAEKVETQQQFEMLRSLGASLFQGYHFGKPEVVSAQFLAPQPGRAQALLALLRRSAPTAEIVAAIEADIGLAFNLLRMVNSVEHGIAHRPQGIEQAVATLGLKKLFSWAALLLAVSEHGTAPSAEHNRAAVARARFMATLTGQGAQWTWVVGALAGLDAVLGVEMARLLQWLRLPKAVTGALLGEASPLTDLLALAQAHESGDTARAHTLAQSLSLPAEHVAKTWEQAQAALPSAQ